MPRAKDMSSHDHWDPILRLETVTKLCSRTGWTITTSMMIWGITSEK